MVFEVYVSMCYVIAVPPHHVGVCPNFGKALGDMVGGNRVKSTFYVEIYHHTVLFFYKYNSQCSSQGWRWPSLWICPGRNHVARDVVGWTGVLGRRATRTASRGISDGSSRVL